MNRICLLFVLFATIHSYGGGLNEGDNQADGTGQGTEVLPADLRGMLANVIGRDQGGYHFTESIPGRYTAQNKMLGLDLEVGPKGLSVREGERKWTLGTAPLTVVGTGNDVVRQIRPNRVEIERGWILEWVVNGPGGLEQGWTVPARPRWLADSAALRILLAQGGNLWASAISEDGRSVAVADWAGQVIWRYAGLTARDRSGKNIPARFELDKWNQSLWLEVADAGAEYPLTIDPWLEKAKLLASDPQNSDYLGISVALSTNGNICAAGAYGSDKSGTNDAGVVYIFTNANGSWSGVSNECTRLSASDRQASDWLGGSVALSADGSICAAGAYFSDPGGMTNAGAVYIFTNANGSWSGVSNECVKLFASDRKVYDRLGVSVALSADGSICAAGAYFSDPGGTNEAGVVYIFTNANGSWSGVSNECAKLFASDRQNADYLGISVALNTNGSICAAGAYYSNPDGLGNAGAVYIFTNINGSWNGVSNECAKLLASDRQAADGLGMSVALNADGSICAVGTPYSNSGGTNDAGAVYIFTNINGSWSGISNECAKLFASDRQVSDYLGTSVALNTNGSICAAGAYFSDPGGMTNAGAVYIFTNINGSWSGVSNECAKLVASDRQADDRLGYSVALSADGSICSAGAVYSNPGGQNDAGAVYLYGPSVPSEDSDSDGMPDTWEVQYGLNPTNAADALTDGDGDGLNNISEYIAGTDPSNAASCLRMTFIEAWQVKWSGGTGVVQYLERTTNLIDGTWIVVETNPPPTPLTNTAPISNETTRGFYRVRATR